jgi:hypothetical protein
VQQQYFVGNGTHDCRAIVNVRIALSEEWCIQPREKV